MGRPAADQMTRAREKQTDRSRTQPTPTPRPTPAGLLGPSKTPAELPQRLETRALWRDQARMSLDRKTALRSHRIDDDRGTRFGGEGPQLDPIHVELQRP